ncbi:MAG: alpha-2-macroglobulin, partial [Pseudomonadota bacterium]
AYWPGSPGAVSLTAWVVEFLVEARGAGFNVDGTMFDRLTGSLKQALRSDYAYFIDGEAYSERIMALRALAAAGHADAAYSAELARRADFLNLESTARVAAVLGRQPGAQGTVTALDQRLWEGVIFRLHQGREIYGGLQENANPRNGLILPSETRTLAEVMRALAVNEPTAPRLQILVDALVRLGQGDGWGSTQANAAAALALTEVLKTGKTGGVMATLNLNGLPQTLRSDTPLARLVFEEPQAGRISAPAEITARLTTRYLPAAEGSQVAPQAQGFVVSRELLQVQPGNAPPVRLPLREAGQTLNFQVGDLIEEHLELVNPADRYYVALVVPLAAGLESLNPRLATAPPEATPTGGLTLAPSYSAYLDDQVAFYYNSLPKGAYHFYFRTRAITPGQFIQPAARAEMMYDQAVFGLSAGARVEVK